MELLEEIQSLYAAYLERLRTLERTGSPWTRLFGLEGAPQNHPCHEQFIADLDRLLRAGADRPLSREQAGAVLDYIYFPAPDRRKGQDPGSWMRVAVHGLTLPLIPLLRPEDARSLSAQYQQAYPRRLRLPAQDQVLVALQRQAGMASP